MCISSGVGCGGLGERVSTQRTCERGMDIFGSSEEIKPTTRPP